MDRQSVHTRDTGASGGAKRHTERGGQRLDRRQSQTEGILSGSLGHTYRDRHCAESQVTATGMFQLDRAEGIILGGGGVVDEVCCKVESDFMGKLPNHG